MALRVLAVAALLVAVSLAQVPRFTAASSPWSVNVAGLPVDANSANVMSWCVNSAAGCFGVRRLQGDDSFHVCKANCSTRRVPFTPNGDFYTEACDGSITSIPVPDNCAIEGTTSWTQTCPAGDDCHLLVWEQSANKLYEVYQASATLSGGLPTAITGTCIVVWDLSYDYGANGRGDGCTSCDAAGFPIASLLYSPGEVLAGVISHPIRISLPNRAMRRNAYRHPASHFGGPTNTSAFAPIYGSLFRLKASFVETSYTTNQRVVITAMKTYGLYLSDGGNIPLMRVNDIFEPVKWATLGITSQTFNAITIDDFELMPGFGPSPDYILPSRPECVLDRPTPAVAPVCASTTTTSSATKATTGPATSSAAAAAVTTSATKATSATTASTTGPSTSTAASTSTSTKASTSTAASTAVSTTTSTTTASSTAASTTAASTATASTTAASTTSAGASTSTKAATSSATSAATSTKATTSTTAATTSAATTSAATTSAATTSAATTSAATTAAATTAATTSAATAATTSASSSSTKAATTGASSSTTSAATAATTAVTTAAATTAATTAAATTAAVTTAAATTAAGVTTAAATTDSASTASTDPSSTTSTDGSTTAATLASTSASTAGPTTLTTSSSVVAATTTTSTAAAAAAATATTASTTTPTTSTGAPVTPSNSKKKDKTTNRTAIIVGSVFGVLLFLVIAAALLAVAIVAVVYFVNKARTPAPAGLNPLYSQQGAF